MEKTRINDGKNVILRLESESVPDKMYEIRMILHSRPQGLLSFRTEETPEGLRCDYAVTGLKCLKECAEEEDTDYLYSVIFSLERLSDILYEYLLSPDRVMLDPETIFLKKETGVVYFCYFPGKTSTFQEALQSLMEFFLRIRNPADEEGVLLLYGLYQRSREADVTMNALAEYWRETEAKYKEEERMRAEEPDRSNAYADMRSWQEESTDRQRIYEDLGLEVPDSGSGPGRRKRKPETTKEMVPPPEPPIYGKAQEEGEEAGKKPDIMSFLKQNYLQTAALVLVIGLIIWLILQ